MLFTFFIASVVANYSKNRVEEGIPLHLTKKEARFDDPKKKLGTNNRIGYLLEHLPLPKEYILVLERWMSNLLEIL